MEFSLPKVLGYPESGDGKPEYIPEIFKDAIVDDIIDISQEDAEKSMEHLSLKNGLFVGVSAGANVHIAKKSLTMSKIQLLLQYYAIGVIDIYRRFSLKLL